MTDIRSAMAVLVGIAALAAAPWPAAAQGQAEAGELTLEVTPGRLTLAVGDTATLVATVRDADGAVVDDATVVYFSRARRSVGVTRGGEVEAFRTGEFTIVALVPADARSRDRRPEARVRIEVPVTVPPPAAARVTFTDTPPKYYVGTRPRLAVEVVDAVGAVRTDVPVSFASADDAVAEVDGFGFLTLHGPGEVEIAATAEDVSARLAVEVETSPVTSLELRASVPHASTGDVVRFTATAKDARGLSVRSVPVRFAVGGETAPTIIAAGATAHISDDGRFVAERSGTYTVLATTGLHSASATISVGSRDVRRDLEVVGRGRVLDRHTSDLWIWEGTDGRDYAITGTWGSDGRSYIWDVTDPANIERLHEVNVDARTVNDVKVSEDGDIAVISREGASNRRNGIVVLGVGNPREGCRSCPSSPTSSPAGCTTCSSPRTTSSP